MGLNILLMSKGIISVRDWDTEIANYFISTANIPNIDREFFSTFLKTAIVEKKILTKEDVPQLILAIEQMVADPSIGHFCTETLDSINIRADVRGGIQDRGNKKLRDFFLKWVVISHIDNKQQKESAMNQFFVELK